MEPTQNDNSNNKRIRFMLIALSAVAIIAIIVIVVVLFVKNLRTPTSPTGIDIPAGENAPIIPGGSGSNTGGSSGIDAGGLIPEKQILVKLWDRGVSGYSISGTGAEAVIRLFDRTQGLFAEVNPKTGEKRVIADKVLMGMHDAYFLAGDRVLVRALDEQNTIHTFMYRFVVSNGEKPYVLGDPIALADNILEIGVSPDGARAAFVIDNGDDASINLFDAALERVSEVAKVPLTEWLPSVTNDGRVILAAKTSADYSSGAYLVEGGKLRMLVPGNIAQTVLLDGSGETAFVSARSGGGFAGGFRPVGSVAREQTDVPFATLAEKCAFGATRIFCGVPVSLPSSRFPDLWYQGLITTQDALYSYDANTISRTLIASPWQELKINLDMMDMKTDDVMVYFIDKSSGALYRALLASSEGDVSSNEE